MKDIQGLIYHCFKNFRVRAIYNFFYEIKEKKKLKLIKIRQGSFLKPLLKPIKKELRFLMRLSRSPRTIYARQAAREYFKEKSFLVAKKDLYKTFLNFFYYKYKKILYIYYKKNKTYITLD